MPNETIEIFNGIAQSDEITLTDGFNRASYIYLTFANPAIDVEIDISLQIYLTPTIQRAIRLENDNILNTVSITLIPNELVQSPFNMQLAIITNQNVDIAVYAVRTECCGEVELDRIKSQLNRIEAYNIVSAVGDTVSAIANGFDAFTIGVDLFSLLLPNGARKGFSIIAPAIAGLLQGSAQIFFDGVPQLVLNSGQYYIDESNFTGTITAQSLTDNPIELGIREFT